MSEAASSGPMAIEIADAFMRTNKQCCAAGGGYERRQRFVGTLTAAPTSVRAIRPSS
jgi:hypothetical protein